MFRQKITRERVLDGLKFITENQQMSWGDLVQGLRGIGCDFTFEAVESQFPKKKKLADGLRRGSVATGAYAIANVVESSFGWAYCLERLLSVDDDYSIYSLIRTMSGDKTYTKEVALTNN